MSSDSEGDVEELLDSYFDIEIQSLPDEVYAEDLAEELRDTREPHDDQYDTLTTRIDRAMQTGRRADRSLDMSGWGLKDLPPDFFTRIGGLTSLSLADNHLTKLPRGIEKLTSLKSLDLSGNNLSKLPSAFAQLHISTLNVSSNAFTNVPSSIRSLEHIEYLDIGGNPISHFEEFSVPGLVKHLDVSETKLVDLPASILAMVNLEYLNASRNGLDTVPKGIDALSKLRTLLLASCNIKRIDARLIKLHGLTILDLSDNQLTTLPGGLPIRIKELNLSENLLHRFPNVERQLPYLEMLDVQFNQLKDIPGYLAETSPRTLLKLDGNEWVEPYRTLIARGTEALIAYLSSLATSVQTYEAKLLLVGEGEVGKSSLIAALRGDEFVVGRSPTHGIEIGKLQLKHPRLKSQLITLNSWDFGGQEVYRITHQFFFSKRALYLLAWKPRIGQEESALEEWCRRIQLRIGNDAAILVVATHGEERRAELDFQRLKEQFWPLVRGHYVVDSGTRDGIDVLAYALADQAAGLPQMGELISSGWVAVRETLSAYPAPYISRLSFERLCFAEGLDEQSAETLANFLHDIGQIIYYGTDEGLRDIIILQAEWLTKAIGFILEDRTTRNTGGVLEHKRLARIWGGENERSYPAQFYPYFLRLMEKFDISYRLPSTKASLVAQLVPYERPNVETLNDGINRRQLRMLCRMSDIALGLIPWLTVRNHRYAMGKHWRRGVYLVDPAHYGRAVFELGRDNQSLLLTVQAPHPQYFFDILRSSVEQLISDRWPGIDYKLMVPCRGARDSASSCAGYFSLIVLEKFRDRGERRIICNLCAEWQDVSLLLTGFEDEQKSLDMVLDRLDVLERTMNRIEVTTSETAVSSSEIARYSRVALQILGSEVDDCPRLFTLRPSHRYAARSSISARNSFDLCLWCEEPGAEHPVAGARYRFKEDREWFRSAAPYLRTVGRLLQVVVPFASSMVELMTTEEYSSAVRADIDATLLVAKSFENIEASPSISMNSRLGRADGAGLRALRQLLRGLDPGGSYGGMRKVHAASGDFYWVCREHYPRYDPGLPSIVGSEPSTLNL